jgi:hypothetical protein
MFGLIRAVHAAEHVSIGTEFRPPPEYRRQASVRVERNAAVFLVLGRRARYTDLAGVPVHALVLNQQHLAAPTAQLQRADDPVVQDRPDELMLRCVHLVKRRVEESLLLIVVHVV